MLSLYTDAKYQDVMVEEKQALFDQVTQDMRYPDVLYGCYECGICVAACPSARFYDFSPRVFAQVMAREDVHTFYELLNDSVCDCSQCFSCTCGTGCKRSWHLRHAVRLQKALLPALVVVAGSHAGEHPPRHPRRGRLPRAS